MAEMKKIIDIDEGYTNFRGSFKLGPFDLGTQAALVELEQGGFVFLDSYSFSGAQRSKINALTDGGEAVIAVLNLHPFHTLHVESMAKQFPDALLYGTKRHQEKFPRLKWSSLSSEDFEFENPFEEDFSFSIPAGTDFVSTNDNVHFSSVLAKHHASNTIHVNDTFNILNLPKSLDALTRPFDAGSQIQFHPTLALALQKRAGAADEFSAWVEAICEPWFADSSSLCAAHSGVYKEAKPGQLSRKLKLAKLLIEPVLALHRLRYG